MNIRFDNALNRNKTHKPRSNPLQMMNCYIQKAKEGPASTYQTPLNSKTAQSWIVLLN